MAVREGDSAPDFTKRAHTGEEVSLSALRGRWVVLYFYPADDTPGCTAEACSFRDAYEDFTDAGAVVIGVSSDDQASHVKFAERHSLPFTLLSDEDGSLRAAYGVRKTLGILPGRVTYVIDPDGVVRKVFSSQLRYSQHHQQALAAIRASVDRA
jgi:thioredoxin-dependent peroxiredoxin